MNIGCEYPVYYDQVNTSIRDVRGQTQALLSWPGCRIDIKEVHRRGKEMADAMNLQSRTLQEQEAAIASLPGSGRERKKR